MADTFAELGLNEQILAGVADLGFTHPTPVQEKAIPAVLEGRDVVASAQTGTGKTAAFALPVLQVIAPLSAAARKQAAQAVDTETDEVEGDASETTEDAGGSEDTDDDTNVVDDADDTTASARVVLDEIEVPHVSVPAEALGVPTSAGDAQDAPAPRRRRARRRHKRVDAPAPEATGDAQVASETTAASEPAGDNAGTSDAEQGDETSKKKRRRRRSRRRGPKPQAEGETQETSSEAPESTGSGSQAPAAPKDAEGTPKKKRRRKRSRRKDRAESLAPDPNAHPFGPFALVVTPTRELAQQIERVVTSVCAHTGQRAVIVMGGAKLDRQIRELERGCDMLVATPGRLIDLMEHGHVDLKDVSVLVLDEADRMLDMGFWPSVRRIIAALPENRQNLLFSATIPPSIKPQIDAMLTDPVTIEISRVGETATTVEEHLMPVTQGQKTQLLLELIRRGTANEEAPLERMLVFCRTKQRADDVSRSLTQANISVDVMHSDRPQSAREKALRKFREGACQVLVATDVMSRGIDVVGIDAVVNFDVPLDPEDYVHRIGRTGRAGATGHAYTFVAPDEIGPLREIEFFTRKLIPTYDLEGFPYDEGRIVPGATRQAEKPKHTMFSGSRSRGRGIAGGRYGRHY